MRLKIEEMHRVWKGYIWPIMMLKPYLYWLSSSDPSANHNAAKLSPKYGLRMIRWKNTNYLIESWANVLRCFIDQRQEHILLLVRSVWYIRYIMLTKIYLCRLPWPSFSWIMWKHLGTSMCVLRLRIWSNMNLHSWVSSTWIKTLTGKWTALQVFAGCWSMPAFKNQKHVMLRLSAIGADVNSKTWVSDISIRSLIERLIRLQSRNPDLK